MTALLFGLLLAHGAASPSDSALTRLLTADRHELRLEGGRVAGSGGRLLVDAGRSARFFLVGEEHGIAQTPGPVQALLEELRPAGYNTLAIEISPLLGERLDGIARAPGAAQALTSCCRDRRPDCVIGRFELSHMGYQ